MENTVYPFVLAKIYPTNYDMSKRWFVHYQVYDHKVGGLVIRRMMEDINRISNKEERIRYGRELCRIINEQLKEGHTLNAEPKVTTQFKHLTIGEALQAAFEIKKSQVRQGTIKDYNTLLKVFPDYLKAQGWHQLKLSKLSSSMIDSFLDDLVKKRSNKTRNNYLTNLLALIRLINNRENVWQRVPGLEIKKLATSTNKHAVFSLEQLKENKQTCQDEGMEYLWLFCQFIYFTLTRPGELRLLKVEHLDVADDRIYIPGENAKGRSGEWIDMYPPIKEIILERGWHKATRDFYVFSKDEKPGPETVGKNYFYKKHASLLKILGLDSSSHNYTLYSYKHSGCCNLVKAGVNLVDIQRQCRHKSLDQTQKYLRELNVFRKKDHFSKVQAI